MYEKGKRSAFTAGRFCSSALALDAVCALQGRYFTHFRGLTPKSIGLKKLSFQQSEKRVKG